MSKTRIPIADLLAELAKSHLTSSIKTVSQIRNKGEINQTYLLDTGEQRVVLRVNDKSELERFKKEESNTNQSQTRGVPAPKVITTGKNKDCAYILLEYIPGKNGSGT